MNMAHIRNVLKGADVDMVAKEGNSALMYSAAYGNFACVEMLLERGADMHLKTKLGLDALMYASKHGFIQVMNLLIEKGASVNGHDNLNRSTLLHSSTFGNHPLSSAFLVKKDASKCCASIHTASERGHIKCLRAHLDSGCNVDLQNKYGITALMLSVEKSESDECTRFLLQKGADVHVCDNQLRTALLYSAKAGNCDTLVLLLEKGSNINMKDKNGNTALVYAITYHHHMCTNALISRGATGEVCAACTDSLHKACESGHNGCIHALLDRGINVNLYNYDDFLQKGKTPLMVACENGRTTSVDILLKRGMDPQSPHFHTPTLITMFSYTATYI